MDTEEQPLLDITSKETLNRCRLLGRAEGLRDLFICSYPKSGTTWMQHICLSLLAPKLHKGHVSDLAPFYEADSTWEVDKPSPTIKVKVSKLHHKMGWRVFNTHLWWRYLPKHQEARYIYVVRDGRDAAVSFFKHLSHQLKVGSETEPIVSSTFAEFHERFVDGSMPYGKWVDHIMSFDAARAESKRILFVKFEDLRQNLEREVSRIVNFLGISISENTMKARVETFRFQPTTVRWRGDFKFIRKGKSGDYKAAYGAQELKMFERTIDEASSPLPSWVGLLERRYIKNRSSGKLISVICRITVFATFVALVSRRKFF